MSAIRAGSKPNRVNAARSSLFCTMTRPSPAASRKAQPSARLRHGAAALVPSPITADTTAGPRRRGNANRAAIPPNSAGFSATW
jgi:hypothetical protein